ncbi:MAG: protease-4 [Flavobacteriales bacterium]|jgi:protease-4
MKQFFKFMFASMLGGILSGLVLLFLCGIMITGVVSMTAGSFNDAEKNVYVSSNSVLTMSFDIPIKERSNPSDIKFNFNDFSSIANIGLDEVLATIEKAKSDDRIKGINLNLSSIALGMASLEDVRNALLDFKTSGKWIVTYGEVLTQGAYYLASVSDEIYLYPMGVIDWKGLSAQTYFLKDMLNKLEIDMQIIRGSNNKFKSAVEPFMLDHMSEANKEQTLKYVGGIWNHLVDGIAAERGISSEELNALADSLKIQSTQDAVKYQLIDGAKYPDELETVFREKLSLSDSDDIHFVAFEKYTKAKVKSVKPLAELSFNKSKIAVIYALGGIQSGEGSDEVIGSERISKAIKKARLDSSIKAIVLRVNSPGGSALASDVIWRETVLAKAAKPLVVSMGNVAASGGYYIACAADRIFAQKNTITGSIGVFGMLPNAKKLFNNKLGIQFDGITTNTHSDLGSMARPLDNYEFSIIQKGVDNIYDDFISKVAEGRAMTKEEVDAIGQGRVWSGVDAMEIGLIDEFGGLNEAIAYAAEQVNLTDYRTIKLPRLKAPLEELMEEFGSMSVQTIISTFVGDDLPFMKELAFIKDLQQKDRIQARIPFALEIK